MCGSPAKHQPFSRVIFLNPLVSVSKIGSRRGGEKTGKKREGRVYAINSQWKFGNYAPKPLRSLSTVMLGQL